MNHPGRTSTCGPAGLILALTLWAAQGAQAQAANPSLTIPLAPLAGPQYTPAFGQAGIGFYGTDLGFTMKHEGQLRIVFGDTWVPGALYGPNLIPEWTEDRGATVDIYWNVSVFAPYQVVLMRSTITK